MTKNKSLARKTLFTIVLLGTSCAVLGSVLSIGTLRQGNATQSEKKIVLDYKTQALEITRADFSSNGRLIRVAVRNVANKNIDWFRISLGNGSDIEADFAFAEKSVLRPGEVYDDEYPFDSKSSLVRVTVVAVVFEDKSTDGDEHFAQLLKEKRAGQRIEVSRMVSLLKAANSAIKYRESAVLLEGLSSEVSNSNTESQVPAEKSSSAREARLIGMRSARERALNEIRRIQTLGDESKKSELKLLEERYNSIHTRLAGYDFPFQISSQGRP